MNDGSTLIKLGLVLLVGGVAFAPAVGRIGSQFETGTVRGVILITSDLLLVGSLGGVGALVVGVVRRRRAMRSDV